MAGAGWLYTPPTPTAFSPDAAGYDRKLGLFPADLRDWLAASQPKFWAMLLKQHGAEDKAVARVAGRLREVLDREGIVHTLRSGIEMTGLPSPLAMAAFKPAIGFNADLQHRYKANRLRVVRQVRYSPHNQNSLDLVLFLNGIPVATAEVKSDYTQAMADAEYQYKTDRHPKPAGRGFAEPILGFPGGALVHFAVSNSTVSMTTRLEGLKTVFMPFNKGNAGAAGNPPNPVGFQTDYLWNDVWQPDTWLHILGRYVVAARNKKREITGHVFPRYHQLDVSRKLLADVRTRGAGGRYLVQHSAGSGKTHSIAWVASLLAELHDEKSRKLFDSVIVVSDRTVLDDQLQEALEAHERTRGVVAYIKSGSGSKSGELNTALINSKSIIVCTLQTFPFALKRLTEISATEGKHFAVVIDEAHSSQSNETAGSMKVLLAGQIQADPSEIEEVSAEDTMNEALMQRSRAKAGQEDSTVSYIAFTATPKAKTLELFGSRPRPGEEANDDDNKPTPFHVYSMRQAIEEGFILDVLTNYLSYKLAFQITNQGDNEMVNASTAKAGIVGWVQLHEHNIARHVEIVVEHFLKHVAPLLGGKGKAMVVTASRVEAVRWQQATKKYIKKMGYKLNTIVAFSGSVTDPVTAPEDLTETSALLNPLLKGQDIRNAFTGQNGGSGGYALLIVANKFQTGFDEPLLCGMYVAKRLAGVQAVQTLSRLNRAYPGKESVFIVDFANEPNEILKAFQPYYETAELSGVSDPDMLYDLRAKLDSFGFYTEQEVDAVAQAALLGGKQSGVDALITPVAQRIIDLFNDNTAKLQTLSPENPAYAQASDMIQSLWVFKTDLGKFIRMYGFLAQIFDYGNTALEKRALFFRLLVRLLKFEREFSGVDLSALALTSYVLAEVGQVDLKLKKTATIDPAGDNNRAIRDPKHELLDEIVEKINEAFGDQIPATAKKVFVDFIENKLAESAVLVEQARANSEDQFAASPDLDTILTDAAIEIQESQNALADQVIGDKSVRDKLKAILLGPRGLYQKLKGQAKR